MLFPEGGDKVVNEFRNPLMWQGGGGPQTSQAEV